MSEAFDSICWTLVAIYLVLASISVFQYVKLVIRDQEQAICSICPSTYQMTLQAFVFIICIVRVGFIALAVSSWDPDTGEISTNKAAFYSLDEIATVLFFSIASILALFWAELYYISIERIDYYTNIVKPIVYAINIGAYIGVIVCIINLSETYSSDVDYLYLQFVILASVTYLFAAIMFIYYAYAVGIEIKETPIEVTARRNRISFLLLLGFICISALIIRAALIIYFMNKALETNSNSSLSALFFFFFGLEILPLLVVQFSYRVDDSIDGIDCENNHNSDSTIITENSPLMNSSNDQIRKQRKTLSPLRNAPTYADGTAPDEMVSALIARLSSVSNEN